MVSKYVLPNWRTAWVWYLISGRKWEVSRRSLRFYRYCCWTASISPGLENVRENFCKTCILKIYVGFRRTSLYWLRLVVSATSHSSRSSPRQRSASLQPSRRSRSVPSQELLRPLALECIRKSGSQSITSRRTKRAEIRVTALWAVGMKAVLERRRANVRRFGIFPSQFGALASVVEKELL